MELPDTSLAYIHHPIGHIALLSDQYHVDTRNMTRLVLKNEGSAILMETTGVAFGVGWLARRHRHIGTVLLR